MGTNNKHRQNRIHIYQEVTKQLNSIFWSKQIKSPTEIKSIKI